MATRKGSYEQAMIWKEITRGTQPGTLAGHLMPLYDYSVGLSETALSSDPEINGSPQLSQPGRGVIQFGGGLVVPCDEVGIGLWLKLLLAGYTKSGVGDPYAHLFKIANAEPDSFGLELGNTAATKFDKFPGCAVTGLSLDVNKAAGKVKMSMDVIGCIGAAPTREGGTSVDAAPSTYTTSRYNLFPSVFKIGGTASALTERVTLNIKREVVADHVLDGNRFPKYCSFGMISVDGQITGIRDDSDTLFDLAMDAAGAEGAETSLEIDLTGMTAGHGLVLSMPECLVSLPSAPGLGGRGNQRITLNFNAYYRADVGASAISATLSNAIADYAAIWTATA